MLGRLVEEREGEGEGEGEAIIIPWGRGRAIRFGWVDRDKGFITEELREDCLFGIPLVMGCFESGSADWLRDCKGITFFFTSLVLQEFPVGVGVGVGAEWLRGLETVGWLVETPNGFNFILLFILFMLGVGVEDGVGGGGEGLGVGIRSRHSLYMNDEWWIWREV